MFHPWLCVSLPIKGRLDSSPCTEHLNSAAETQPALLTSVQGMQADLRQGPTSCLPAAGGQLVGQQRQTEALIPPKDEQAGTALSNVAAFLANAWRRSHCPRPFPSSGRRKPVPALFLDSHLLPLQAAMGMGPALSCFLAPDSSPEEKGEHPHLSLCHPGLIYREKQLIAASFAK